jgi:hypothetical protein
MAGSCEECIENQCYGNGCNCNCIQRGNICYTEWLGGAEQAFDYGKVTVNPEKVDHSKFLQAFIVLTPSRCGEFSYSCEW